MSERERHGLIEVPDRRGRPLTCLAWSSGAGAAAEGTDLAGVARTLSDQDLAFWAARFRELPGLEYLILEAEQDRRGADRWAGPLFWRDHG